MSVPRATSTANAAAQVFPFLDTGNPLALIFVTLYYGTVVILAMFVLLGIVDVLGFWVRRWREAWFEEDESVVLVPVEWLSAEVD
jgi:hypothetical protein